MRSHEYNVLLRLVLLLSVLELGLNTKWTIGVTFNIKARLNRSAVPNTSSSTAQFGSQWVSVSFFFSHHWIRPSILCIYNIHTLWIAMVCSAWQRLRQWQLMNDNELERDRYFFTIIILFAFVWRMEDVMMLLIMM